MKTRTIHTKLSNGLNVSVTATIAGKELDLAVSDNIQSQPQSIKQECIDWVEDISLDLAKWYIQETM